MNAKGRRSEKTRPGRKGSATRVEEPPRRRGATRRLADDELRDASGGKGRVAHRDIPITKPIDVATTKLF